MSLAALADDCRRDPPIAALVLGSGLNAAVDDLPQRHMAPFAELPGMPGAGVAGHRGRLCLHDLDGRGVLVFQGRVHFYEGHDWDTVARPVHLAHELGARTLILTNASGGIGERQTAGSLMAVRDHIPAMTPHWYRTPSAPTPYSPGLLDLLTQIDPNLPLGVYAAVTGPNYETPAEVRMLQSVGADAVGMSTVHEANVGASLGMEVAAISCVANRAAGLSASPLSHAEVLAVVASAARRMTELLHQFLRRLPRPMPRL